MTLVVHDSFAASAQNPTLAETLKRTDVWSRLLFPIIPEDKLQQCFDIAFNTHDSTFPVSAYDLKAAWDTIRPKDLPQWQADRDACKKCDERGYVLVEGKHQVCKHV